MSSNVVYADQLAMTSDIAASFNVSKSTVQTWMRNKTFPAPVAELRAGAVYDIEAVRKWRRERVETLRKRLEAEEELG